MVELLDILVAEASDALASEGVAIGVADSPAANYELFHAPNSICSQKVRTVLAYHDIPYVEHSVNLFQGESYLPAYVRLRMVGCESLGGDMAAYHSGSTSTETGGCDGVVVPTLVDVAQHRVVVDSKRICLHIDGQVAETARLCPPQLAPVVLDLLNVVDNIPNYQMLMGRVPADPESADTRASTGSAFSKRKVEWCDQYLRQYTNDDVLIMAYAAKRAKELSAANELFSVEAMTMAYAKANAALENLERLLKTSKGPWILDDVLTMADLFWGIELLRMENIGIASFWEERLPEVTRFLAAASQLDCIRSAVLTWPGSNF